jgi:tRNA U34 2-thiouridine synthase MnmA/TrmU
VALGERQYVRRVDVQANVIQLGRRADLERGSVDLEGLSLTSGRPPSEPFRALVRVRHRATRVPGWIMPRRPSQEPWDPAALAWRIELDRPVWAPAPGQAAVLYDVDEPDRVLGGGRIAEPAWRD